MTTQKTQRVLLTRPVTTPTIGLRGSFASQAETMVLSWRLLSLDHTTAEICAATGLCSEFVNALQDAFWGD